MPYTPHLFQFRSAWSGCCWTAWSVQRISEQLVSMQIVSNGYFGDFGIHLSNCMVCGLIFNLHYHLPRCVWWQYKLGFGFHPFLFLFFCYSPSCCRLLSVSCSHCYVWKIFFGWMTCSLSFPIFKISEEKWGQFLCHKTVPVWGNMKLWTANEMLKNLWLLIKK